MRLNNKARSIKQARPVSPALPVLPLMEITSPAGDYGNVNKRCGVCRGRGGVMLMESAHSDRSL